MLPITLGENERKYLASQKKITIDLQIKLFQLMINHLTFKLMKHGNIN